MAKATKRKVPAKGSGTSGRVTPKGGHRLGHGHDRTVPEASARYTPPIPKEFKQSPRWVPVLMGVLLGLGVVIILANYLSYLPTFFWYDEKPDNAWLLTGLASILGGIVVATQWE